MRNGKAQVLLLALLAFGLLAAPTIARAAPNTDFQLQVGTVGCPTCGFTTIDNGAGDSNGTTGIIGFNGAVGVWSINTGNAFGPPVEILPLLLDISSFNATTSGGGTGGAALGMWLTIQNLSAPLGTLSAFNHMGGTSSDGSAMITSQAFIDPNNKLFCGSGSSCSPLTSLLSLTGKTFAGDKTGSGATGPGKYSVTLLITLASAVADQTSFDSELSIPEPATLSVLGAGLFALGTGLKKKLLMV
jgi:hypothetical protein